MLYSVTVAFSHDVMITEISGNPGSMSQANCSVESNQYTKSVTIVCRNLNYTTSHVLLVKGVLNITDAEIPLDFIVDIGSKGPVHS